MLMRFASSLLLSLFVAKSVCAADFTPPTCNENKKCPEKYPCCSVYNQCGTGAYCLGGCNPLQSFSLDSCAPEPVCKSKTYTWDNLDNAATNNDYLGNATAADWVYSGSPKVEDGNLLLTMPKNSVGTLMANNHYLWYGKIGAKIKTSRGKGVVTAFILLSDTKDEIDYEWVGSELGQVQTNFYFQGILNYTNGDKTDVSGDTFEDWHLYEVDWSPDEVNWLVDGDVIRTLKKADTWNETANRYEYPQTPSRMQMSLWPAGQASNAEGTIEWAGGEIDWNSEDIKNTGYYYATIGQLTIDCYNPPSSAIVKGDKSYVFINDAGLESSVEITGNDTVLASLGATGLDMDLGGPSSSASASVPSSTAGTIPPSLGGTGTQPGSNSSSTGSGGTSTSTNSPGSFNQGTTDTSSSGKGTNAAPSQNERVLKGSFFAVLVAIVVLVTL